jgi:hypothetical protein
MKNKVKYTDEPMGKLKVVNDFLPPTERLVLKEDNVNVTTALKKGVLNSLRKRPKTLHLVSENDPPACRLVYSYHQKSA